MEPTKAQAKKFMKEYMAKIEANTFCHAKGCKRKRAYLKKYGYCGSPINGKVYCMAHQSHLEGVKK